jgi:hypothetical protein
LGATPLIPTDAETRAAHPATGALLGPVVLSLPIIAPITCADFRFARDRFAGYAYRPRLLPGTAGWHTCGHLMPVRRRISPVPYSAVQAFRSPYAGGFLGAAIPSSSPRPWPSPGFQGLGSLLTPRIPRVVLRRCRIRIALRTACLLDPNRAFVVALRRFGSLLAPATSYTAAWSLLWPDFHRLVEYDFQDARDLKRLRLRLAHPAPPASPRLTAKPARMTLPLRSSPITGPSQLLRSGPPLCPASLLSPSQICCLGFSLQTTSRRPQPLHWPTAPSGRQVPEFRTRAQTTLAPPSMPDTHLASQQAPARLVPGQRLDPGFGCRRYAFDTSSVVRFRSPS